MLAADLLTLLLVAGIVVLIISTTIMAMNFAPRARRRRRRSGRHLSDTAAHTLALAEARAATHRAELATAGVTAGARSGAVAGAVAGAIAGEGVTGQLIDISDGLFQVRGASREMTVEYAQAIAEHVAETDPQRVAEVISQWIRADSTIDPDLFR